MDITTAALLAQDGITSGAVYGLLALALVLVFSVTRVIFLPQGEFVAYGDGRCQVSRSRPARHSGGRAGVTGHVPGAREA